MSGYNGVLPDMRALITRYISVVDRTPITVKSRRQHSTHQLLLIHIVIHCGLVLSRPPNAMSLPKPS
jgi:hypothetical protein